MSEGAQAELACVDSPRFEFHLFYENRSDFHISINLNEKTKRNKSRAYQVELLSISCLGFKMQNVFRASMSPSTPLKVCAFGARLGT